MNLFSLVEVLDVPRECTRRRRLWQLLFASELYNLTKTEEPLQRRVMERQEAPRERSTSEWERHRVEPVEIVMELGGLRTPEQKK